MVAGDGCDATCRSELIPGGGPRHTDCVHEWLTSPVPPRGPSGLPAARLVCIDDDPSCDFGAAPGDAACTFHVALCLNVRERRVSYPSGQPLCTPTDVAWITLTSPREGDPQDAADAHTRDALEAAIVAIGGTVRRQCEPPGTEPSTTCASDADCGRSHHCRSRLVTFTPPLDDHEDCTPFAEVVVPLRHAGGGIFSATRTLRLIAATSSGTLRDSDALALVCRPATR